MSYSRIFLGIILLTNIILIATYNFFYAESVNVRVLVVEKKEIFPVEEGNIGNNNVIRKSESNVISEEQSSEEPSDKSDLSEMSEPSDKSDEVDSLTEIKEKEERKNKILTRYLTNSYE
jgi:hypothetical protein